MLTRTAIPLLLNRANKLFAYNSRNGNFKPATKSDDRAATEMAARLPLLPLPPTSLDSS